MLIMLDNAIAYERPGQKPIILEIVTYVKRLDALVACGYRYDVAKVVAAESLSREQALRLGAHIGLLSQEATASCITSTPHTESTRISPVESESIVLIERCVSL